MLSFIITLTYMGKPILLRFENNNNMATYTFEVRALNDEALPVFTMEFQEPEWKIITPVADELRLLEGKMGRLISAYVEGLVARAIKNKK